MDIYSSGSEDSSAIVSNRSPAASIMNHTTSNPLVLDNNTSGSSATSTGSVSAPAPTTTTTTTSGRGRSKSITEANPSTATSSSSSNNNKTNNNNNNKTSSNKTNYKPSNSRRRKVRFDQVFIHEFPIILGDNPSVSKGAPLTLSWKSSGHDAMEIEMYEYLRLPERKQNRRRLILSNNRRMKILLHAGHSVQEIAAMAAQVEEDKRIRAVHALEASRRAANSNSSFNIKNLNPNMILELLSGAAEGTGRTLFLTAPSAVLLAANATTQAVGTLTTKVVTRTGQVVTKTGKAVAGTGKLGYDVVKVSSKMSRDVVVGGVTKTGNAVVGTGKMGYDVVKGTSKVGLDIVVGSVKGTGKVVVGTGKAATGVVVGTGKLGYDVVKGTVKGTGNVVKSTVTLIATGTNKLSMSIRDLGYGDEDSEEEELPSSLLDNMGQQNNQQHQMQQQQQHNSQQLRGSNRYASSNDIAKIPRRTSLGMTSTMGSKMSNFGRRVVGRSRSGGRRASLDNKATSESSSASDRKTSSSSRSPPPSTRTVPKHSASAQSKLVSMVRSVQSSTSSKSLKGRSKSMLSGSTLPPEALLDLNDPRESSPDGPVSNLEQMQQYIGGYGYSGSATSDDDDEDEEEDDDDHYDRLPQRHSTSSTAYDAFASAEMGDIPDDAFATTGSNTPNDTDEYKLQQPLQESSDAMDDASIRLDHLLDGDAANSPGSSLLQSHRAESNSNSNAYDDSDESFVSAILPPEDEARNPYFTQTANPFNTIK